MANQEQNLPQREQPFIVAKQVSFNLEDIILNTNNEVALLYPKHTNKEYFKCLSDFISKCCLRKPFTKSPNMYQKYLAEFWKWFPTIGYGEEASTKGTLRKSLLPPRWSIANGIHIDYANIFWEDIILKMKKKQREKVVPYTRFISLLIMHKMKEDHGTDHMPAICALDKPVVFKAPKTSLRAKSVSLAIKPGAKTRHKKPATSSKQPSVSRKEATKDGPLRNPLDQQATGGPTSLGVTSEERSNPQLSSGMQALNLNKPIFSSSFIIHTESASGHDVSADFTVKADPGLPAPNDSISPPQGMDEGTKNTSYDHISAGTDPHVLAEQTKSVSEGLETVFTQPITKNRASFTAIHGDKEEASTAIHGDKEKASSTIKFEDLAKLVS
nr:hypothetical protein [Tanacetum cinerariifolium]